MLSISRRTASLAVGCMLLTVAGCGSSSGHDSSSSAPTAQAAVTVADPTAVLARVGSHLITGAMFNHWLIDEARTEPASGGVVPIPPKFKACIARVEVVQKARKLKSSQAARTELCRQQYLVMREGVMDHLISNVWRINAAVEAGIPVSDAEVQRRLAREKREAEARHQVMAQQLAAYGLNMSDRAEELHAKLSEFAVREAIKAKYGSISDAEVASYYRRHRASYAEPERRDLEIVGLKDRASALKAKRKIEAGASFASIVKKTSWTQPQDSNQGTALGLAPGEYSEAPLSNAIFAAKPGVLSGPVHITLGFYVFRVKKIHPGFQKPLAAEAAAIKRKLPEERQLAALAAFIKHWRARWKAQTDCSPGYVVSKCRQYVPPNGAASQDNYSFK